MDFVHIYELHKLLSSRRHPTPLTDILAHLECSDSTFFRIRQMMMDYLGAPIRNKRGQGYYYDTINDEHYELPGLWFTARELVALGVIEQLSESFQPDTIKTLLAPLRQRIGDMLQQQELESADWQHRIKIVSQWQRPCEPEYFNRVAHATLHRQQLEIDYWRWSSNVEERRIISPQRLVYYRDNWYLDAWCHLRDALRTFSLDAIRAIHPHQEAAREIAPEALDQHVLSGYGIFAGNAASTARLKFNRTIAARVSRENWHPQQHACWTDAGEYILEIPYSKPDELLLDILRHGANVEVLAPQSLRDRIQDSLEQALKIYHENSQDLGVT